MYVDLDLSSLTLSAGTLNPTFSSAIKSYTVLVTYSTASVIVTPTAADAANVNIELQSVAIASGASREHLLSIGNNVIVTRVSTAGVSTDYTITIYRAPGVYYCLFLYLLYLLF